MALNLAIEKGASTWLTALHYDKDGFALHGFAFQDAFALHYSWFLLHTPTHCACGTFFLLNMLYLLSDNEIRDLSAAFLTEVCS